MANGNYEYQSDFARRYVAQGRNEGRLEGRNEGRNEGQAHALLRVLEARRIEVPLPVRERILTCADTALLDLWLTRAVTAATAAAVVDA